MRNGIQFIHLRRPVVKVERKGMWMGDIAPTGGLTIAVQALPNEAVYCAVARCNLTDRYNRKEGRKQALQKLNDRNVACLRNVSDVYEAVLEYALNDKQLRRNLCVEVRHG